MRPSNLNFQDGGMVNGSPYDIDSAPEVTGIRPARKRKNCGERVYGFFGVFSRASYLIPRHLDGRAIAFRETVAFLSSVIPAQAGIQGRVTGFGALDSRLRGNDGNREVGEPKCDCPALKGAGKNWEPPTLARTPIQPVP
jgi:hypothetical protein